MRQHESCWTPGSIPVATIAGFIVNATAASVSRGNAVLVPRAAFAFTILVERCSKLT
jgi:hypothetical protein